MMGILLFKMLPCQGNVSCYTFKQSVVFSTSKVYQKRSKAAYVGQPYFTQSCGSVLPMCYFYESLKGTESYSNVASAHRASCTGPATRTDNSADTLQRNSWTTVKVSAAERDRPFDDTNASVERSACTIKHSTSGAFSYISFISNLSAEGIWYHFLIPERYGCAPWGIL